MSSFTSKNKPLFTRKHNKKNLTQQIVSFWFTESAAVNINIPSYRKPFPVELCDVITRYFPVTNVLDIARNCTELLDLAKIAESAWRYGDFVELMLELTELRCYNIMNNVDSMNGVILSVEERKFLSLAFKNCLIGPRLRTRVFISSGPRLSSWRALKSETDSLKEEVEDAKQWKLFVCNEYLKVIETELLNLKIKDVLEDNVIKTIEYCKMERSAEAIFYFKMAGDYWRYIADLNIMEQHKQKCEMYYKKASLLANEVLPATSPLSLSVALDYSAFLYQIENDPDATAFYKVTKTAFEAAYLELGSLDDGSEEYKESRAILQLLRDNLDNIENDIKCKVQSFDL